MGYEENERRVLNQLEMACQQLQETTSVPELCQLLVFASGLKTYAQANKLSLETSNEVAVLKLRVKRKIGQALSCLELRGGDRRSRKANAKTSLNQLGLSRMQASRFQLVGSLPEERFRNWIDECKAEGRRISEADLHRMARVFLDLDDREAVRCNCHLIDELLRLARRPDVPPFACIVIAPTWSTAHQRTISAQSSTWRQIAALPICELAAPRAHLYIWVPNNGCLLEAQGVFDHWGFTHTGTISFHAPVGEYRSWCRSETSFALLAARGELGFRGNGQSDWYECLSGGPSDVDLQEVAERFSPPPYLHIFAENGRPDWRTIALQAHVPSKPR